MLISRLLRLPKLNTIKGSLPIKQFSNLHIQKVVSPSLPLPLIGHGSITYNPWMYRQNDSLNLPRTHNIKIDLPNDVKTILPKIEPNSRDVLEDPTTNTIKKEAVTMIVIRRKKMKKHKLKKLRKRMKYVWAKQRQRREWKKEKAFQAELIQQCKNGETFSAEQYIDEKIKKFKEATQVLTQLNSSTELTELAKK